MHTYIAKYAIDVAKLSFLKFWIHATMKIPSLSRSRLSTWICHLEMVIAFQINKS